MRELSDILKDGRLKILSNQVIGDELRVTSELTNPVTRKTWFVIFTNGLGWEHLSISSSSRTPDWDTMCLAKSIFWRDDECCVEYHPRKEDYVNMHEHCLHIWKPLLEKLPTPPSIMVGFRGMDEDTTQSICKAIVDSIPKDQLIKACEARGIRINRQARRLIKK